MRDARIPDQDAFIAALCESCRRRLMKVLEAVQTRGHSTFNFGACDDCHDKLRAAIVVGDVVVEAKS